MILKLLLNTQMIWTIFIKILKNTIQTSNAKILIDFDDMIADMFSTYLILNTCLVLTYV